jgi:hypothetical protein
MATSVVPLDDSLAGTVALAGAGDETAFARIIKAHHDDMTRVCFVICGDLDVADEAAQAAWPIVWRKLGSLRDPARLRPGSCRSPRMKRVSSFGGDGAGPSSSSPWSVRWVLAWTRPATLETSISPMRWPDSIPMTEPSSPSGN